MNTRLPGVPVLADAAARAPPSSTASTTTAPGCSTTSRAERLVRVSGTLHGVLAQRHHPVVPWISRGAHDGPGQRSVCWLPAAIRVPDESGSAASRRLVMPASAAGTTHVVVGHPPAPQGALVDRDEQLALALERRLDQPGEQRVRPGRAATAAPGAPGWRRSTGARRPAARRTPPGCRPARCRRTPGRPPRAARGRRC